ncbi:MAG: hypothetical protein LBO80_03880 [Treponema sp.]|jgi:hypothetical protein|nr:hypothetical protein [Treponema sp.]
MKKIILLIIILGLGGSVFFLGWAQLTVPPGSCGVLRSKTFGIDPRPIREGEFRWVWYKLIPTNVSIEIFQPKRFDRTVNVKGALPQGESYASLAGLKTDFSYEIGGSFSFGIKAAALPALISEEGIEDQAGLEEYQRRLAGEIERFVVQRLYAYGEDPAFVAANAARISGPGSLDFLEADILNAFPHIEDLSLAIRISGFPDFALYNTVKALYEDYLKQQRELLQNDIFAAAGRNLSSRLRFDELEKYGELLTKYPILLEYLALENKAP